jgi:hypothetical protein
MRELTRFLSASALLIAMTSVHAQVGVLQGTVAGVKPGTMLPVFKGDSKVAALNGASKVADIKVEEGGKFSVALATGVYTVHCPGGKTTKVAALNGAATISINCQ